MSKAIVDKAHFQQLSEQDPQTICRRSLCRYDPLSRCYSITVWGIDYRIFPHAFSIECHRGKSNRPHRFFDLFLIQYLTGAQCVETTGEWISEKDFPGGPTFFRGPHSIPTDVISKNFKNDIDAFKVRCAQLHGRPVEMADAAYIFEITARIPVAVLYWIGDNDFPAEAKLLYDSTITRHLTADIVFALAVGICDRLAKSDAS